MLLKMQLHAHMDCDLSFGDVQDKAKIRRMFDEIDNDNSGEISTDEWTMYPPHRL